MGALHHQRRRLRNQDELGTEYCLFRFNAAEMHVMQLLDACRSGQGK